MWVRDSHIHIDRLMTTTIRFYSLLLFVVVLNTHLVPWWSKHTCGVCPRLTLFTAGRMKGLLSQDSAHTVPCGAPNKQLVSQDGHLSESTCHVHLVKYRTCRYCRMVMCVVDGYVGCMWVAVKRWVTKIIRRPRVLLRRYWCRGHVWGLISEYLRACTAVVARQCSVVVSVSQCLQRQYVKPRRVRTDRRVGTFHS